MNPVLWAIRPPPDDITLFFAFKPPPGQADEIARRRAVICGAHGLRGHVMGTARLHMTLACCHRGRDGLDQAIARARSVGEGLRHPPVAVLLDRTQSFNRGAGPYPFVLRGLHELEDIIAFRAVLRARMRRAGFVVDAGFTPHVTLVWTDRLVGEYPTAPIRWQADELLLIESHVGQSRHGLVASWRLD